MIQIRNVATNKLVRIFQHDNWIFCVIFSLDNQKIIVGSGSNIKIYEIDGCRLLQTLSGHKFTVDLIVRSFDPEIIASSSGSYIMVHNITTGKVLNTFGNNNGKVHSLAFSPDNSKLATNNFTNIRYGTFPLLLPKVFNTLP